MKFTIICLVIATTLTTMVSGESFATISFGACPSSLPVIPTFTSQAYGGIWYEIKRFPNYFEGGYRCVTNRYNVINSTFVRSNNTAIKPNGMLQRTEGVATVPDTSAPNKLALAIPFNIFGYTVGQTKGDYNVLDTDFVTYSAVYSCVNGPFKLFKLEYAWVLSRTRTLDAASLSKAYAAFTNLNININNFIDCSQDGCTD